MYISPTSGDNETIKLILIIVLIILILFGVSYWYFESFEQKSENTKAIHTKESQKKKVEKFHQKEITAAPKVFKSPKGLEKLDNNKELYELYFKGVPDTFDIHGIRIPGVEPDAKKAIGYLRQLIQSPQGTKKDILNLAKLYHQGMHKFEPDLDRAEEVYNSLANDKSINEDIWQQVMEGLSDIHTIRVYDWLNIPLPGTENELTDTDLPDEITGDVIVDNTAFNINQIIAAQDALEEQRQLERAQAAVAGIEIETDRGTKGYNDPQNTHDSQVLSTIRVSLDKLKESPQQKNSQICLREVRSFLQTLPDSDKKKAAFDSLSAIQNINSVVTGAGGEHELDALALVWNRIHDPARFDTTIAQNLRETMFDELADMQEHGATVCSTGRITRLIDTLNGVDEEVIIKPTYAINEEMMNKSSSIRDRLLEEQPEGDRDHLEAGTHARQEEFDQKLKDTIIMELKKDYVDTKILTQSKFNTEIKKWIDFI